MKTVSTIVIKTLHEQCVANGDTHLSAICQIALHGFVPQDTYAKLREQPRAVLAEQYGVDESGMARAVNAKDLAAAECLRFLRDQQEPISLTKAMPEILALLAGGAAS